MFPTFVSLDKYQLGFTCEEILLTSLGWRLKVLERVHFSESERAMQNIRPGVSSANLRSYRWKFLSLLH